MDKFWIWMESNDYGGVAPGIGPVIKGSDYIPKQMLIGYMMEYLLKSDEGLEVHIKSNKKSIPDEVRTIVDIYEDLKFLIEEL